MVLHPAAPACPAFLEAPFGKAFEHRVGVGRIEDFIVGYEFVERPWGNQIEKFKGLGAQGVRDVMQCVLFNSRTLEPLNP